jgi:hypothetical protein
MSQQVLVIGAPEPASYYGRDGQMHDAINKLTFTRTEELETHLQDCGKKVHHCELCYELYSNIGGDAMLQLLLWKKAEGRYPV